MRKTENFELNLLDGEDFVNKDVLNDNAERIDQTLKEHDTPEYEVSEQTNVEKLSSGESLKVALRKLAKAVADYISHKADQVAHITAEERTAWTAKLGAEKIAANLTTTTEGMVLAAAMGKTLKEQIDTNASAISTLNSNLGAISCVDNFIVSNNTTVTKTFDKSGTYLLVGANIYKLQCIAFLTVGSVTESIGIAPVAENTFMTISSEGMDLKIVCKDSSFRIRIYRLCEV